MQAKVKVQAKAPVVKIVPKEPQPSSLSIETSTLTPEMLKIYHIIDDVDSEPMAEQKEAPKPEVQVKPAAAPAPTQTPKPKAQDSNPQSIIAQAVAGLLGGHGSG